MPNGSCLEILVSTTSRTCEYVPSASLTGLADILDGFIFFGIVFFPLVNIFARLSILIVTTSFFVSGLLNLQYFMNDCANIGMLPRECAGHRSVSALREGGWWRRWKGRRSPRKSRSSGMLSCAR